MCTALERGAFTSGQFRRASGDLTACAVITAELLWFPSARQTMRLSCSGGVQPLPDCTVSYGERSATLHGFFASPVVHVLHSGFRVLHTLLRYALSTDALHCKLWAGCVASQEAQAVVRDISRLRKCC